jgi:hypothetical protein
MNLGIKQNNYGIKKLGHRASTITCRDTGRGLSSTSLSLKEQREPRQDTTLIIYTSDGQTFWEWAKEKRKNFRLANVNY